MLNGDDASHGKTTTITSSINLVDDRCIHIATPQKIRVQGVRGPPLYGPLRGRQRLTEYLPAEHLRTANIATVAAKNIVFDLLQLEESYEVVQNRVHRMSGTAATAVNGDSGSANEYGIVTGEEENNLGDVDGFPKTFGR